MSRIVTYRHFNRQIPSDGVKRAYALPRTRPILRDCAMRAITEPSVPQTVPMYTGLPTQHKTKIVCTIGPASVDPEVLLQLAEGGMDVVRLNMTHGDQAWHASVIKEIRALNASGCVAHSFHFPLPRVVYGVGKFLTCAQVGIFHSFAYVRTFSY
jgi:hypothetical protein